MTLDETASRRILFHEPGGSMRTRMDTGGRVRETAHAARAPARRCVARVGPSGEAGSDRVCASTFCATDPITRVVTAECPWRPVAIRSALHSSANLTISSAGSPRRFSREGDAGLGRALRRRASARRAFVVVVLMRGFLADPRDGPRVRQVPEVHVQQRQLRTAPNSGLGRRWSVARECFDPSVVRGFSWCAPRGVGTYSVARRSALR